MRILRTAVSGEGSSQAPLIVTRIHFPSCTISKRPIKKRNLLKADFYKVNLSFSGAIDRSIRTSIPWSSILARTKLGFDPSSSPNMTKKSKNKIDLFTHASRASHTPFLRRSDLRPFVADGTSGWPASPWPSKVFFLRSFHAHVWTPTRPLVSKN